MCDRHSNSTESDITSERPERAGPTSDGTPAARALGRLTAGEAANGDFMAARALLPYQRTLNLAPKLARWLLERGPPGAFAYFNARSRATIQGQNRHSSLTSRFFDVSYRPRRASGVTSTSRAI
jgi:hypothetical protein